MSRPPKSRAIMPAPGRALTVGKAAKSLKSATEVAGAVQQVAAAYMEYAKVRQQERTKRKQIRAAENERLAAIAAQRDLIMAYLDRSFDERRANFEGLFRALDQAIAEGRPEVIATTLHSITELASSGPFRDIASVAQVRDRLADPDEVFEV